MIISEHPLENFIAHRYEAIAGAYAAGNDPREPRQIATVRGSPTLTYEPSPAGIDASDMVGTAAGLYWECPNTTIAGTDAMTLIVVSRRNSVSAEPSWGFTTAPSSWSATNRVMILLFGSLAYYVAENGSGAWLTSSDTSLDWHVRVLSYDGNRASGSEIRAYRDGVYLGENSGPSTLSSTVDTFVYGYYLNNNTDCTTSTVVALHGKGLTQEEVNLYASTPEQVMQFFEEYRDPFIFSAEVGVAGRSVAATLETLELAEYPAIVLRGRDVQASLETLEIAELVAQVTRGAERSVSANTETMVLQELAAAVLRGRDVSAATETLVINAFQASVERGTLARDVNALVEGLLLRTHKATVDRGGNRGGWAINQRRRLQMIQQDDEVVAAIISRLFPRQ